MIQRGHKKKPKKSDRPYAELLGDAMTPLPENEEPAKKIGGLKSWGGGDGGGPNHGAHSRGRYFQLVNRDSPFITARTFDGIYMNRLTRRFLFVKLTRFVVFTTRESCVRWTKNQYFSIYDSKCLVCAKINTRFFFDARKKFFRITVENTC